MINEKNERKLGERKGFSMEDVEKMPPIQIMLYLGMLGSAILFAFLIGSFLLTVPPDAFAGRRLPRFFILSTLLLLSSSFIIQRIAAQYHHDDRAGMRSSIALTLSLGFLFALTQYIGWREMRSSGLLLQGLPSGSYIYVISGVHLFHTAAGLLLLMICFENLARRTSDPVRSLIYFTDPYERLKLKLVSLYWHYLGTVWLVIFVAMVLIMG